MTDQAQRGWQLECWKRCWLESGDAGYSHGSDTGYSDGRDTGWCDGSDASYRQLQLSVNSCQRNLSVHMTRYYLTISKLMNSDEAVCDKQAGNVMAV